jgi:septal ring factor EnvC (AmiA/AmiB activator)
LINFGIPDEYNMKIEVSNGELVDKLTILEIKLVKIKDIEKLNNVRKEHAILQKAVSQIISKEDVLYKKLLEINQKLWEIEDKIREFEKKRYFGRDFIETARLVYVNNDIRAKIKKEINLKTNSDLFEEKSYEDY